ncbi:putative RING-finger protein Mag2/Rnf10 [Helianthus debilis subsp. tardiflorus]
MSILPSQNLGSSSSSSSHIHSQNPNLLNHGSDLPQPDPSHTFKSLHISDPADSLDNFTESSVSPTPEPSGGSSKKVKELPGKKIPARQKSGAHYQHNGSGQSSMGFPEHRRSLGSHQRHRSNQGGTPPSAGRKSQGVNANHLLNFHYDPISRPQARTNPPRRLPKRKPYIEERKKHWKEKRNIDGAHSRNNGSFHTGSPSKSNFGFSISEESFIASGSKSVDVNEPSMDQTAAVDELIDGQGEILSSSYEDNKGMQMLSDSFADKKMKGSYDFYQAADGQHLILHPLNMRCLVHHYGSYDRLPQRISGKILQLETITQSEAMRRRYRYLSHFSLTTTFQLCEVDLSGILPASSLSPFEDELKNREKQRKRVARKEHAEKVKAEAAAAAKHVPVVYDTQTSYDYLPAFSLDDFEALGSSSSNPPTMVDRPLFSNVTRLGFAAAHDSPTLRTEEAHVSSGFSTGAQTTSFANVISRAKPVEVSKASETGKKGKKASKVLLSTSGGRRY